MTRLGIGFAAAALLSSACMHGSRSGNAASGARNGKMIATAAQSGAGSAGAAGANAPPAAKKEVEGRVELIDRANNLTLAGTEQVGHAFDKLKVDDDTKVTVDGQDATIADVNPGDEVRASFSGKGDELHVDQLEVLSSSEGRGSSNEGTGSDQQK